MEHSTEIVPTQVLDAGNLDNLGIALREVEDLSNRLPALADKAKSTVVKYPDRAAYTAVGEVLSEVRSLRKQGEAKFTPFELIVDRVKTKLRTWKQKHSNACEEIEAVCKPKMKAWEQEEASAKQREQDEINRRNREEAARKADEQRRAAEAQAEADRKRREKEIKDAQKAGEVGKREADKLRKEAEEQAKRDKYRAAEEAEATKKDAKQVIVRDSTPAVAGYRRTTNYGAIVENELLILHAYVDAYVGHDERRVLYLRRFLQANEKELGKESRDVKDPAKLTALIPGVRFTKE